MTYGSRGLAAVLEIADDLKAPLEAEEWGTKRSPYTGRKLRTLRARTRTHDDELHRRFLDAVYARGRDGLPLRVSADTEPTPWTVQLARHTTRSGNRRSEYSYVLDLEELEEYEVSKIRIAGMEMEPLRYAESLIGETLQIEMVVRPGKAGEELLFDLWRVPKRYVEVVRIGVDEHPREMRIGPVRWHKGEEDRTFNLSLLDRNFDEKKLASPAANRLHLPNRNARARLAHLEGLFDELVNELEEHGVLPDGLRDRLAVRAEEGFDGREFGFFRVEDPDDLMDI